MENPARSGKSLHAAGPENLRSGCALTPVLRPPPRISHVSDQVHGKGGRLRLIAIYTGVRERDRILEKIVSAIPEETKNSSKIEIASGNIVSASGLRIVWLFKGGGTQLAGQLAEHQVEQNLLAERLQREFSKLSQGLLANVALATIAALRDATHHALGKFTGQMDGPYFHHRTLLKDPREAQDYAVAVVLSELKNAVDRQEVGDQFAGSDAIEKRVKEMASCMPKFAIKFQEKGNDLEREVSKEKLVEMICKGRDAVPNPNGFPRKNLVKDNFTSIFEPDRCSGREAMMKFASLTGVRSHAGSNLHGKTPRLVLGSIIHCDTRGYLLCLQASCDTVRVQDGRGFFFVPVKECQSKPDQIVPYDDGNSLRFLGLKTENSAYTKAVILKFSANGPGDGGFVRASPGKRESEYWFTDIDGAKYQWIANLKARRAMRAAQQVSQQLSRIGFDEFEPFRPS